MAFKVAIPTLHREKILEKYTLSTLLKKGINPKQIDIWVADNQEKEKYETSIPSEMYNAKENRILIRRKEKKKI